MLVKEDGFGFVVERSNGRTKQLHEKIGVDERLAGRPELISQWSWCEPEVYYRPLQQISPAIVKPVDPYLEKAIHNDI